VEAIGDITASAEISRLKVDGEEFDSRIQGGILVRAVFSQNMCSITLV
jgi:xanthine/uracil permease